MVNESQFKISVVIPMYNSEKTIERALNSVISQTYKGKIEIIVVNDGSKDNSAEIVENYCKGHSKHIIQIINQPNGGVSKARNTGLKHATGEFIALLDSDDEWIPEKTSIQMKYFDSGNIDFVTALRNNDKISFPYSVNERGYVEVTLNKLLFKIVGHTSTAIFKRKILEKHGYFDENQRYSEDANYWMKVSHSSVMIMLNKKLVITGGGKPSIGHSGLSSNIEEMEKGAQKNIDDMKNLGYINVLEYIFFKLFAKIKYIRRIIIIKILR